MSLRRASFTQRRAFSFLMVLFTFGQLPASGQPPTDPPNPLYSQARDRITRFIDDDQRVTLRGNRHPRALAEYDAGAVRPGYPMERMLLTLLPEPSQQEALNQFVEAQHNPDSPYYHQWLTPEQFADRFGVSESDIAQIVGWLQSHGLEVEEVAAGRRSIVFNGTAAQVLAAFHTEIHSYKVGGEVHHANAREPEIPEALVQVVGGVVSLHDFHSEPLHAFARKAPPEFSSGGSNYLAPRILPPSMTSRPSTNRGSTARVNRLQLSAAQTSRWQTSASSAPSLACLRTIRRSF